MAARGTQVIGGESAGRHRCARHQAVEDFQLRARQLTPSACLEARRAVPVPLEYGTGLVSRPRGVSWSSSRCRWSPLRRNDLAARLRNLHTPAGYVGYLTRGAVFGKSIFYGTQRGPTSAGRSWLLDVTNVSVTPYTYTEDFTGEDAVLSKDNLKIAFRVHTVWRVDESRVPLFMERFSTTMSERGHEKEPDAIVVANHCGPSRATRCNSAMVSR